MILTIDELNEIFPHNPQNNQKFIIAINSAIDISHLNTINRLAGFLAETGFESKEYQVLSENLNYSADALLRVFPKYFTKEQALQYAHKPIAIANRVYANRYGNGIEASGDGWKYRGAGCIQITFKSNYQDFATWAKMPLNDTTINYLRTPEGAIKSACWFWNTRNLNEHCDKEDIAALTKEINGSYADLDDRKSLYNHIKLVLSK